MDISDFSMIIDEFGDGTTGTGDAAANGVRQSEKTSPNSRTNIARDIEISIKIFYIFLGQNPWDGTAELTIICPLKELCLNNKIIVLSYNKRKNKF